MGLSADERARLDALEEEMRRRGRRQVKGRHIVLGAVIFGLIASPVALAVGGAPSAQTAGGNNPMLINIRNRSTAETGLVTNNNNGYSLRLPNNTRGTGGGGAYYGCYSTQVSVPCVRGNNASTGMAFQMFTTGTNGGQIMVGGGGSGSTPFTTNASGLVSNFNADMVDGQHASAFQQACQNGTIKGYASIDPGINPTVLVSYNCAGGTPTVQRNGGGNYDVFFPGQSSTTALVTVADGSRSFSSLQSINPGGVNGFQVKTWTITGPGGNLSAPLTDVVFTIAVL